MKRTWNSAFSPLLQYLLAPKCNQRGSSLIPQMEPACILVHSVGEEGYLGCFLGFSLEYLCSECFFLPFGLRW